MEFLYRLETRNDVLLLQSKLVGNRYELVGRDGEQLAPTIRNTERLVEASKDQPEIRCYTVPRLGSGGFGSVVRAHEESFGLPRAVKFLNLQEQPDSGAFKRELLAAGQTPFKHIVPLIDYGEGSDAKGKQYGYLVWQFVPGTTLRDFLSAVADRAKAIRGDAVAKRLAHDVFLGLVTDILAALGELHGVGLAHMDLKDTNVLIYPPPPSQSDIREWLSVGYRAFVIDLGGAQSLRGRTTTDRVRLVFTPDVFPRHLVQSNTLGYDGATHTYSSRQIGARGVGIDLSCLGTTLNRVMNFAPRDFWEQIFQGDTSVLQGLIQRLIGESQHDQCDSAREMKRMFETIPLAAARGIFDSDLLTDRSAGLRIRLGPHLVKVARPLERVVNHPVFQRLRHLQQLSFVSQIYPDGTHTRFSHSLRTFHLAKQFIMGLARKRPFRLLFERRDIDRVLAAALLHDLGQYPLSHCLEDLRKIGDTSAATYLSAIRHDQELVGQRLTDRRSAGFAIADALAEEGVDIEDLDYLIQKRRRDDSRGPVLNISRDIINGVIDVDRVSYLLHDSEHTGVPYGAAIDVGAIVEGLTIKSEEKAGRLTDGAGLGLEPGAISAAEAVLAAVHWMYRNVYWHHTNRAFMASVKFVVQRLLKAEKLVFADYVQDTSWSTDTNAESYAIRLLRQRFEDIRQEGVNPLSNVLQLASRVGYRRAVSLGYDARDKTELDDETRERNDTYDRIVNGINPESEDALLATLEGDLPRDAKVKRGEILIDVPLKRRLYRAAARPLDRGDTEAEVGRRATVWVERRSPLTRQLTGWIDLNEYSPLADALARTEDHSGRKVRVFYSNELLERLRGNPGLSSVERLTYERLNQFNFARLAEASSEDSTAS